MSVKSEIRLIEGRIARIDCILYKRDRLTLVSIVRSKILA